MMNLQDMARIISIIMYRIVQTYLDLLNRYSDHSNINSGFARNVGYQQKYLNFFLLEFRPPIGINIKSKYFSCLTNTGIEKTYQ